MKRKQKNSDTLQMDLFADNSTPQTDSTVTAQKDQAELNTSPEPQSNQVEPVSKIDPETRQQGSPRSTEDSFYVGTNGNRVTVTYVDYLPDGVPPKPDARDIIQRALQPWEYNGNTK